MSKIKVKKVKKSVQDNSPEPPAVSSSRKHLPSNEEISNYIAFCFRSDILKQLMKSGHPHVLATTLFEKETGIHIPLTTSHIHLRRWMLVGGKLLPVRD